MRKTIGKTKENECLLCGFGIPPWDVQEGIRGDRIPDRVSQKPFKNVVKTKVSEKTRSLANPMGPSGAPSALRGPQCFAKAHVEIPWENKGYRRFLEVPLCYVRDGIRGEQIPVTFNQKTFQTVEKQANLEKPASQQIPWGRARPRARHADTSPLQGRM